MRAKSKRWSLTGHPLQNLGIILAFSSGPLIASMGSVLNWPSNQTALALLIAWLSLAGILVLGSKRASNRRHAAELLLAAFVFAGVVCTLLADVENVRTDAEAMWRQLGLALCPVVLFWGAAIWARSNYSIRAVHVGVFLITVVSVASVLLEFFGILTSEAYGSRYFGWLGDSVAWLLSFTVIFWLAQGRISLASISFIALFLTQSRGAALVLVAATGLFLFASRSQTEQARIVRIALFAISAIVILAAPSFLSGFVDRLGSTNLLDNDRIRTTALTLEIFGYSPIYGSGYNSHSFFFLSYFAATEAGYERWATATSTWAQVLADFGILGFLPFVGFLIATGAAAWKALRVRQSSADSRLLAGIGSWLIAFLFLNQSAAWLLPSSLLAPLVFACSGLLVGGLPRVSVAPARQ